MLKDRHIFIGWDNREAISGIVCKYSILKSTEYCETNIQFLEQKQLRKEKLYYLTDWVFKIRLIRLLKQNYLN